MFLNMVLNMVLNVVLDLVLNSSSYILDNDCFPSLPPMQKLTNKAKLILFVKTVKVEMLFVAKKTVLATYHEGHFNLPAILR